MTVVKICNPNSSFESAVFRNQKYERTETITVYLPFEILYNQFLAIKIKTASTNIEKTKAKNHKGLQLTNKYHAKGPRVRKKRAQIRLYSGKQEETAETMAANQGPFRGKGRKYPSPAMNRIALPG